MKKMLGKRKCFSLMLVVTLIFSNILVQPTNVSKAATDYGLSNPRVEMLTRDVIEFGSYWQEDTNGDGVADQNDEKTPIKWQILKQDGDDLFLLADRVLDNKPYNDKRTSVTWETSTLRAWMNGEFYDVLFTSEEKKAVKETAVKNEDNPYYGTEGGNDTKDNLFLLSLSDIINTDYVFSDDRRYCDQARHAKVTDYAKGAYSSIDGVSGWWLRSSGDSTEYASYVNYSGSVYDDGDAVNHSWSGGSGVRPALHLLYLM